MTTLQKTFKRLAIIIAVIVAAATVVVGSFYAYAYASTPAHLRAPQFEHYHFRTQIIVDGTPVDFSREEFQEGYEAGSCSATLTSTPIHFHDNQDQLVHIHWRGMTGGEFLKNYGWNLIGGNDNSLGWQFDQGFMSVNSIATFGNLLPKAPDGTSYFIYIGDEEQHVLKDWNDFLTQDLEDFMGKKSLLNTGDATSFNLLDILTPRASADNGSHSSATISGDDQKLEKLNNLIGNIVIFAQKDAPTPEQVTARFNNLVPLKDSVCGG